jgi:hypothetical protein
LRHPTILDDLQSRTGPQISAHEDVDSRKLTLWPRVNRDVGFRKQNHSGDPTCGIELVEVMHENPGTCGACSPQKKLLHLGHATEIRRGHPKEIHEQVDSIRGMRERDHLCPPENPENPRPDEK